MAGPSLTIYLPEALDTHQESEIREYLNWVSNHRDGDDFWIGGQPFFWGKNAPDEEELLLTLHGWTPKETIYLCAMCNNAASHVLLASTCIKIAQMVDGMIHLDDLTSVTKNTAILTMSGHIRHNDFGYIVEPSFLSFWLGEKDFCLIK